MEIKKENSITTFYGDYEITQDDFNVFTNPHKPLFYISNRINEGNINMMEKPENFLQIILLIFEKTLNELGKFRKIEDQIILKHLETKM